MNVEGGPRGVDSGVLEQNIILGTTLFIILVDHLGGSHGQISYVNRQQIFPSIDRILQLDRIRLCSQAVIPADQLFP